MNIPLNANVHCSDGVAGRSTVIVVDPHTETVTHVVVDSQGTEFLVPIDVISESGADHIQLRWSLADLAKAERYDKVVYVGDGSAEGMGVPSMIYPATMDAGYMTETVELSYLNEEQVPENELAIHRGAHVEASDGRVGQIDEFVIDLATGQITHLVLRQGHLWGKKDVTVPVSAIDHIQEDLVILKLDKAAVEQLPHVPVKRS
jgi:sporulation protein YlmC with PRC-barrel domain